ncbi:hypothetical protein Mgra_00009163 [Meloidogyne graminicola]|uniref:Uncharacterized protein n=1 Tax=Meloidogyne graminicola TaxID=189291 RepID=A0A8S9ZDR7_9BILA|nr:hypothetical protein Mgra_00009163 [Meloidogyne graminicola]
MKTKINKYNAKILLKNRNKDLFRCDNYGENCFLIVKNLYNIIEGNYLSLSSNLSAKLDVQSFCLTNFLFKKYDGANVIGGNALTLERCTTNEDIFNNHYSILVGEQLYYFRWDFERTNKAEEHFPNVYFKKETQEFEGLKICNEFLKIEK